MCSVLPWLHPHSDGPRFSVVWHSLTSDTDTVVPRVGVEAFAALLKEATPTREVSAECLEGSHARLLDSDGMKMRSLVASLAEQAGLPSGEERSHGQTYSGYI